MSSTTCPISFTNLRNQYVPGSYLVETKKGFEFRKQNSWFLRCWDQIFLGKSYALEKTGAHLLQKASDFLKNKKQSIEELEGVVKVLVVVDRFFYGASLLKTEKSDAYQKLKKQADHLTKNAWEILTKMQHKSKLALCLELGKKDTFILEKTYKEITPQTCLKKLPQDALDLLSTLAWEKEDTKLLGRLFDLGCKPPKPSLENEHCMLTIALQHEDDHFLASLIKHGYHCNFNIQEGKKSKPFALACMERGMSEAVQAMVDKKVPLSGIRDNEGNTLLHTAFLFGNIPIAKALLQAIDPTITNNDGQTPLACLRNPIGKKAQELKLNNTQIKSFIENIVKKEKKNVPSAFHNAVKSFFGENYPSNCDDIELSFLVGSEDLTNELFKQITREQFESICTSLAETYPKEAIGRFFLSSFSFTEAHYKKGCEMVPLSKEVEAKTKPEQLLNMLRQLKKFNTQDENALTEYLRKVRVREAHIGTPKLAEAQALEDFYKTIEINLKYIVHSLQQKNDPDLTTSTLKEFILAAPLCGGRHYAVAWQQALTVCCGAKNDPLSLLERSLAECRGLILEAVIRELYPKTEHNVHMYNRALHDLGKKLGIPRCCNPKKFNDILCKENYNHKNIKHRFRKIYTPYSLIYDWLLPKLKTELSFRNDYIDLQKTLVPKDWKVPDIDRDPQDLDKEPTEEEKWYTFVARFVHNEKGELKPSAIRDLLEKEGIIYCRLDQKPKHLKGKETIRDARS